MITDEDVNFLDQEGLPNTNENEVELVSYSDIYSDLLLNDEIILTIPAEEEERLRTGIKNVKAKLAAKHKEEGLPVESSTLTFTSTPSAEFVGASDIHIVLSRKAVATVFRKRVPDKEF